MGIEGAVEVDTWTYPVRAGDVVLLCSDGLTSMIGEDVIAGVLSSEPDSDRAGERLIAEANAAGGRDNITVVLFRLEEVGDADPGRPDEQPTEVGMAVPARGLTPDPADPSGEPAARSSPSASATMTVAVPASLRAPAPARWGRGPARPWLAGRGVRRRLGGSDPGEARAGCSSRSWP